MQKMPPWADALLVPLLSLLIAFAISSVVIFAIGAGAASDMATIVAGR